MYQSFSTKRFSSVSCLLFSRFGCPRHDIVEVKLKPHRSPIFSHVGTGSSVKFPLYINWLNVSLHIWLVVWLPFFNFPIYWVANHPNWLSYFSEGWPNHQHMLCIWYWGTSRSSAFKSLCAMLEAIEAVRVASQGPRKNVAWQRFLDTQVSTISWGLEYDHPQMLCLSLGLPQWLIWLCFSDKQY